MTPEEKAQLRKAAEALVSAENGKDEQLRFGAFCKFAVVARGATVLALLDENARLAAEVERLTQSNLGCPDCDCECQNCDYRVRIANESLDR